MKKKTHRYRAKQTLQESHAASPPLGLWPHQAQTRTREPECLPSSLSDVTYHIGPQPGTCCYNTIAEMNSPINSLSIWKANSMNWRISLQSSLPDLYMPCWCSYLTDYVKIETSRFMPSTYVIYSGKSFWNASRKPSVGHSGFCCT